MRPKYRKVWEPKEGPKIQIFLIFQRKTKEKQQNFPEDSQRFPRGKNKGNNKGNNTKETQRKTWKTNI
jgi:hypothetical protein